MPGDPEPRIVGSYRLEERIGRGGMGEVYRARHTRLDTERAVKLLPPALVAESDFLKRFEREAASAARLEHPNILPVYEYGEAAGAPYLVMPYVRGGTLKDRLAKGPITVAELLNLLGQAAEALDYAHEQGIVHRDVKPANLLLDGRGRLYLADFGIAKALEGAEGLTRTGVGVGTPEYMAPEQAQGRADARSDLYALGVILYQLLTGRVPYTGNSTVEVLMKHLQDPLPLLPLRSVAPAVPPRVEAVVTKALAKNPNERYASGKALVEDLREAFASTPAGAEAATIIGATPFGPATVPGGPWTPHGGNTAPAPTHPGGATPLPPTNYGGTPPPPPTTPGGPTPVPYAVAADAAMVVGGQPIGHTPIPGGTPPPQGQHFAPPATHPGGVNPTPLPVGGYSGGQPSGGAVAPRRSRRGLIGGIAGGLAVLLLLCIGITAFAASRLLGAGPTPTVQVAAQPTTTIVAAVNVGATQTAVVAVSTSTPTAATAASTSAPTVTAAVVAAATAVPTAALTATATGVAFFPSTSPSAVPTATVRPTTAPQPTTRPSAQAPSGIAPAGWKTYLGSAKAPFAMYYPPDWQLDESELSTGTVRFVGQDGLTTLQLTAERAVPGANIDVLRDQYFRAVSGSCDKAGVEGTDYSTSSGIRFAELAATCDTAGTLLLFVVGAGLNGDTEWDFLLGGRYGEFNKNTCRCAGGTFERYFQPMLDSLVIYGNP